MRHIILHYLVSCGKSTYNPATYCLHFILHCAHTPLGMCVVLASTLLLAGCAYFGMRWADGDIGKIDTERMAPAATNDEGEHNLPWFSSLFIGRDKNVSNITNMLLFNMEFILLELQQQSSSSACGLLVSFPDPLLSH